MNNNSKAYTAPVSLGSMSGRYGYGTEMANNQYQYLAQLAQLRQGVALARAQKQNTYAQLRTTRVGDTAAAANSAADRGGYGSSVDMAGRAGAAAAEGYGRSQALSALSQARLGAQQGALDARSQYMMQNSQIQQAMAAERAANGISAFQNDTFDVLHQNYQDILNRLRDQKTGAAPRSRTGVGGGAPSTYQPPPNPYNQTGLAPQPGPIQAGTY